MILNSCQFAFKKSLVKISGFCLLVSLFSCAAYGKSLESNQSNVSEILPEEVFPQNGIIKKQKIFWKKIFGQYKSYQHIIHDRYDPEVIVSVIDFNLPKFKRFKSKYRNYKSRDKLLQEYINLYQGAISKIMANPNDLKLYQMNPFAKTLRETYGSDPKKWSDLIKNGASLRSQAGLRDDFDIAVKRSDKYLPLMEKVFSSYGLPMALTRLPFVESMFSNRMRSKVGASGVWQFMPRTAKTFVRVNQYFDERNSPLKATRAAARLFKSNFKYLKSWPLAVTAYNHGISGLKKAMRKYGVSRLDEIVERYQSGRFGFASRNFYAEFLAATEVYSELQMKRSQKKSTAIDVEKFRLKRGYSLNQLTSYTPLSRSQLKKYNQCLTSKGLKRYRHKPLPRGYELYVPKKIAKKFKKMIKKIKL